MAHHSFKRQPAVLQRARFHAQCLKMVGIHDRRSCRDSWWGFSQLLIHKMSAFTAIFHPHNFHPEKHPEVFSKLVGGGNEKATEVTTKETKKKVDFMKSPTFDDQFAAVCPRKCSGGGFFICRGKACHHKRPGLKHAVFVEIVFYTPAKVEPEKWWVCKFGSSPFWWSLLNIRGIICPEYGWKKNI